MGWSKRLVLTPGTRSTMAVVEAEALNMTDLKIGLSSASKSGGSYLRCRFELLSLKQYGQEQRNPVP